MKISHLIALAIALRIALLIFGTWQDTHLNVKYTDIDYEVYTDAARFVVAAQSPYQRSTYRYTPLLAALLTPNILVHKAFGKIVFSIADIVAALLFIRLLQRHHPSPSLLLPLSIWLFSPLTATISTRGNGEALVTCMLLAMLDLFQTHHLLVSGTLYGLAVHWRLYPVIYSLPILVHLLFYYSPGTTATSTSIKSRVYAVMTFGIPAATTFLGLGIWMYWLYGQEFVYETYLYHASRVDPRHNFSPYFYPAYLSSENNVGRDFGGGDDGARYASLLTVFY